VNWLALGVVVLFAGLIVVFWLLARRNGDAKLRRLAAYEVLERAISYAVEDGTRVHVSLGRGEVTGPNSAAALVGLSVLRRVGEIAGDSDEPPVATAGEGALGLLSQDALRGAYRSLGHPYSYDPTLGRVSGLTPFSYAAGAMPVMADEKVSATALIGSTGVETALIASAGNRSRSLVVAGSDSLPAQAILYAAASQPLIGEELYAGGAYLGAGSAHLASLHAQDVVRWLLILVIVGGALGKLLGVL